MLLEELHHASELGRKNFAVSIHQRVDAGRRLEKSQVTQLIDLVAANGLSPDSFQKPRDVVR